MCGEAEHCVRAADVGEFCSNDHLCKSYLYCRKGSCVEYGKVKNGMNPGDSNPALCESHYISKQGLCAEGPKLNNDILVDSPLTVCHYSNGQETSAKCAFHKDGKAICKPEAGDLVSEWQNLLDYLKLKPKCNPIISALGQCDYGEKVGEQQYLLARIAYTRLNHYEDVLGNLDCVQKYRYTCLLYTSPSPRDLSTSRMPSSACKKKKKKNNKKQKKKKKK
eukprot:TRINITY_DN9032_c0_g1_i13.p1 TRINITY_DN9032_c0_g1~~TRINITY_DN9032_c0_g1_i13.p1  ORF type:complete len:221 (-),score=39.56 TRINITY_DN9032_c0_g1_i13:20-682(-)